VLYQKGRSPKSADEALKNATLFAEVQKKIHDTTPFDPSIDGIDLARRAIMYQMSRIVEEVDRLTKDPSIAIRELDID
jgi:hypothetical protein